NCAEAVNQREDARLGIVAGAACPQASSVAASGRGWHTLAVRGTRRTRAMRTILPRILAAVPDTMTAAFYLAAWVAPALIGAAGVRNLLGAVVIEFLVMHASALYGFGIARREDRLAKRTAILG